MATFPRITGLDQLRGVLATIVMIFHYACLTKPHLPSFIQLSLDKLGYYSVCSFYVLSGAALYIVYHKRSLSLRFCRDFFIKRLARIAPLFWLATTLALALQIFNDGSLPSAKNFFLVYSLLFSWVDPGLYYVGGAWSIGNEWAFYSLFPLMLLAKHWGRLALGVMVALSILVGMYFAVFMLDPGLPFSDQWRIYINPANHFFLFLLGFCIASPICRTGINNSRALLVMSVSTLAFVGLSMVVSDMQSISGFYRFAFSAICVCWCYASGVAGLRGVISKVTEHLGRISYSLYLLHFLVFQYIRQLGNMLGYEWNGVGVAFLVAAPATLLISTITYYCMEKPAMNLGGRIVKKLEINPTDLSQALPS